MGKKLKHCSPFKLEGRFLSFVLEDGYKIKRLNLATAEGEVCIKLSKEARASVGGILTPGDWISVSGEQYVDPDLDERKYKAYLIQPATPGQISDIPPTSIAAQPVDKPIAPTKPQATILMCQKSDCMKRGGKAVCDRLRQELRDRGLADQVAIKSVGCMKDCKAGPNLVVMPAKARYSRIHASEVRDLVDRHFVAKAPIDPALASVPEVGVIP